MNNKKKRIFDIIQIGYAGDVASRTFDIAITAAIIINLFIAIFDTFEQSIPYQPVLDVIEWITVIGFTIEYILRVWTAEYLYPNKCTGIARIKYIFSGSGIVDLLSFLPNYLPVFFPAGAVDAADLDARLGLQLIPGVRVIRILRIFRVNSYYDALNVITEVIRRKWDQILSSVFIIVMLIIASSLCMYSLEHEAQPEVFKNAFSGIWWSVSTLLTVGYGDIYPVTVLGKMFSIIITFLGVGMVAIPTGILSAGFVEQYSLIKKSTDYLMEKELKFIKLIITKDHNWNEKKVCELSLPRGLILAAVLRNGETLMPKGDMKLFEGDCVVIGARDCDVNVDVNLKQVELREHHPWVGHKIKELDISRHTLIVMIRRGDNAIVPNGDTLIKSGDIVFVFSKRYMADAQTISV